MRILALTSTAVLLVLNAIPAAAHHSSLLYNNGELVQIEGVVVKAFFGNPHSRYSIAVSGEDDSAVWTIIAQDPSDARRFGYFAELEALTEGQTVTVVGWPHRRNRNEMLGHQLVSNNGQTVELIPLSGYVRPPLYQAMDQAVVHPRVRESVVADVQGEAESAMLARWIMNDHPIARAGAEEQMQRARLIEVSTESGAEYPGMPKHLACQQELRTPLKISAEAIAAWPLASRDKAGSFIATYNRVLSKHWELHRNSCGN